MSSISSQQQQEREKSGRGDRSVRGEGQRSASPSHRPGSDDGGRRERDRERRDKSIREHRSISPSRDGAGSDSGGGDNIKRERDRHRSKRGDRGGGGGGGERSKQRRTRRNTNEMAWVRPGKSPGPSNRTSAGREDVVSRQMRQLQQQQPSPSRTRDGIDELVAQHRDVDFHKFNASSNQSIGGSSVKTKKKRNSKTAAIASSRDIDEVIAQYREQCDIHMATLLELKNNITTTEKEVVVSSEKDKEFEQVRKWYSALAEKHTKLQKEHQALQEEHVKLQEKYMNLKRASNFNGSFADFGGVDTEKKKEKKDKKDKTLGDIVWSRAAGTLRKNKNHQQLE